METLLDYEENYTGVDFPDKDSSATMILFKPHITVANCSSFVELFDTHNEVARSKNISMVPHTKRIMEISEKILGLSLSNKSESDYDQILSKVKKYVVDYGHECEEYIGLCAAYYYVGRVIDFGHGGNKFYEYQQTIGNAKHLMDSLFVGLYGWRI